MPPATPPPPINKQASEPSDGEPSPGGSGLRLRRMSSAEKAKRSEAALISSASAAALAPNTPLPPLAVVFQQAAPALEIGRRVINVVGPAYMHTFRLAVWAYETAPLDLIQAATGLGLCFFGGAFS